jgi:UDP-N-acetylmuramyl pentapeptide synthase
MTLEQAVLPIRSFYPVIGRMSPQEIPMGITIIRDDWKAPYWSIALPMKFLGNAGAKRKVAIIGTISDYTTKASKLYPRVCRLALASADHVIFVGQNAHRALRVTDIPEGKTLKAFFSVRELANYLHTFLMPGDLVVLKGSGGDHLARLALMFEQDVKCWRERCRRQNLCDNCQLLSVPNVEA